MSAPLSGGQASHDARVMSFQPGADYQQINSFVRDEATRRQAASRVASGSADVEVSLDALADLYNRLSDLHEQLSRDYQKLQAAAEQARATDLTHGLVPQIEQAWQTIVNSAGWGPTPPPDTLLGNIQMIDQQVLSDMKQVLDTMNSYADVEHRALGELRKVTQISGYDTTAAPVSKSSAVSSSGSGSGRGWGTT